MGLDPELLGTGLVNKYFGTSFDIVKKVYEKLGFIELVANNLTLAQGIQGIKGDTIYVADEYSSDNSSWHSDLRIGDVYRRVATVTNGVTGAWSVGISMLGNKGDKLTYADLSPAELASLKGDSIYTEYQYSIDTTSWHFGLQDTDFYRQERLVTVSVATTAYGVWSSAALIKVKGDTGSVGQPSKHHSIIYYAAVNKPATPNGGSFTGSVESYPLGGWSNLIPTPSATENIWISSTDYTFDGTNWVSQGWSAPTQFNGIAGKTPVKGVDYLDGVNGVYYSYIFSNATTLPSTPAAGTFNGVTETIPLNWTDNPTNPNPTEFTWISKGSYLFNSTSSIWEFSAWSIPTKFSAKTPVKGVDYFDGTQGKFVSFIFLNSSVAPSAPVGGSFDGVVETFPATWTDAPTVASTTQSVWVSKTTYSVDTQGIWTKSGWSTPTKFKNKKPQKGIDYFDGVNGTYTSFVFKGSVTRPADPVGGSYAQTGVEVVPATWFDNPYAVVFPQYLWVSKQRYVADALGVYVGQGWNTPVKFNGDKGYSPSKGVDYFDGKQGRFTSFIFTNTVGLPATPTTGSYNGIVEVIPSTWTDDPISPTGNEITWVSRAIYTVDASGVWNRITGWSTPTKFYESNTYMWQAFADTDVGGGISLNSTNKSYVGYATGQATSVVSITNPSIFTWHIIKVNALNIVATARSFTFTAANVLVTPTSITCTVANIANAANTVWATSPNVATGTGSSFTLTGVQFGANNSVQITATNSTYTDIVTIFRLKEGSFGLDGLSALTTILSNEAHTVPSDNNGANISYTGSGTSISVYEGATLLTYDGVGTSNATWTVTAAATGITVGAITVLAGIVQVADHSNMTVDLVNIIFTITGKRANGAAFSFTKQQTIVKAKSGTDVERWYLKPLNGTAIKNSVGNLTVVAEHVKNSIVSSATGNNKIYVNGSVLLGSEYSRSFSAVDITGSLLVELKNGVTILDTVTLIDVTDGSDAVVGSVTSSNGLLFSKDNVGAWSPVANSTVLTANFYKKGNLISTITVNVTVDKTTNTLTSNSSTVTNTTSIGENSPVLNVTFTEPVSGTSVTETVYIAIDGANGINGLSSRLDIAYATNSTGTSGASFPTLTVKAVSTGKTYIGTNVITWLAASTIPSPSILNTDYEWTLIKGSTGASGISNRVDFAYSDNASGLGNTRFASGKISTNNYVAATSIGSSQYLGTNVITWNATSAEPIVSTVVTDYEWTLIKGSNGTPAPSKYTWVVYSDSKTTGIIDTAQKATSPFYTYTGVRYDNLTTTPDTSNHSLYSWYIAVDVIDFSKSTMFLNKLDSAHINVTDLFAQQITVPSTGSITGANIQTAVPNSAGYRTVMSTTNPLQVWNGSQFIFGLDPNNGFKLSGTLAGGIISDIGMFSQPILDLLTSAGTSTSSSTGGNKSLVNISLSGTTETSTSLQITSPNSTPINISIRVTDNNAAQAGTIAPSWNVILRRDTAIGTILLNVNVLGSIVNEPSAPFPYVYLDETLTFVDNSPNYASNSTTAGKYIVAITRNSGSYGSPLLKSFTISQAVNTPTATTYTLPPATTSVLGGVKVGANLTVDINGVLSANAQTSGGASYTGHRVSIGTGNTFNTGGFETRGNGTTNTIFPTVGFHQPGLYAGSIQLRAGGDFWFVAQGGTSPNATVRAANFAGQLNGQNNSVSAVGNTIVSRDSLGYISATYFNSTGTYSTVGTNSGMGLFSGTNGTDIYGRTYTAAAARQLLNVANGANNVTLLSQLTNDVGFTTSSNVYYAGAGLTLTGTTFTPTFGTGYTSVARGNHNHNGVYLPVNGTAVLANAVTTYNSTSSTYYPIPLLSSNKLFTGAGSPSLNPVSGNISTIGTVFTYDTSASSDIRLKKNIKEIQNASQIRQAITGNFFDKKRSLISKVYNKTAGLIADTVEKVFPIAILQDKDGIKSLSISSLLGLLFQSANEDRSYFEDKLNNQQKQINELKELLRKGNGSS